MPCNSDPCATDTAGVCRAARFSALRRLAFPMKF
jgi:hypothetical protein